MSLPQSHPVPIADPKKNPSYPQRVHLNEKAHWLGVLQTVESRVAEAQAKFQAHEDPASRPAIERIFAQMLGARDQVAAAVKRLPQETGHLYEEDHHRVDDAVAALDRLFLKWDAVAKPR